MVKLDPSLKCVLAMDLCEIVFDDPASTFRATAAAIAEGLQRYPISSVEVNRREAGWIYSLQSDLRRPISAQRDGKLRHGDTIPAEADMIQRCRVDGPVFRRTDQAGQISFGMLAG